MPGGATDRAMDEKPTVAKASVCAVLTASPTPCNITSRGDPFLRGNRRRTSFAAGGTATAGAVGNTTGTVGSSTVPVGSGMEAGVINPGVNGSPLVRTSVSSVVGTLVVGVVVGRCVDDGARKVIDKAG